MWDGILCLMVQICAGLQEITRMQCQILGKFVPALYISRYNRSILNPILCMSKALTFSIALLVGFTMNDAQAAYVAIDTDDGYREQVAQVDERILALAKSNVDAFPEVKNLLAQNRFQAAIELLEQLLPNYENDANYFNLLGVLYLHQKSYANAASAFERVVLIQSDNAGAWLDLAIANADAGNHVMARQYFDYIEQQLQPPPTVLALINAHRTKLAINERLSKHWSGKFEYQLGYDSNANSGLLDKNIVVTYQGGRLEIPIDGAYIARPDSFRHAALQSNYQTVVGGQQFFWNANALSHHFTNEHQFSSYDLSTNIGMVHRTSAVDVGAAMNFEHFVLGKRSLLNNHNFSLFFEKNWGDCQANLVIEHEQRRHLLTRILDGGTVWKSLALSCTSQFNWGGLQSTAIFRDGVDRPLWLRPGGKANRKELIAKTAWHATRATKLEVSVHLARSNDAEGYSPLLENNAAREILRRGYQVQWQTPTSDRWSLVVNWSRNASLSNLSLFRQRGASLSVGVQKQF